MNISKAIRESIKERGIWGTLQVTISYIIDYFFDIRYHTDTFSWVELEDLQIESKNIERGERYQPTHALPLRNLFRKLQIPTDKTIVDLGSGKCKVLLVAAEYGFKKARGIEFSKELCAIANQNFKAFSKKHPNQTKFDLIQADVSKYPIHDDEDIFYLFNPFDDVVLSKVLSRIITSIKNKNRRIWIIYFNALHKDVIDNSKYFTRAMEYKSLGQEFLVYMSN
jgi:SAM-dependent methyltransferase